MKNSSSSSKSKQVSLLSRFVSVFTYTFLDNSDGCASSRRAVLWFTYLSGVITNLTSGTFFTGLMLAIEADEIYISYITIATTICGFLQFLSPLFLERMKRRKTYLFLMKAAYLITDILILSLIVLLPMEKDRRLILFMLAIILRNLTGSLSTSGISILQMQSIPAEKQNLYFTFSNIGTNVIGIVTAFFSGNLVDYYEGSEISIIGTSPTVSAILVLRMLALIISIPDLIMFAGIKEFPYSAEKKQTGLRLLLVPFTNRRFMITVSICFMWTFLNSIIGEFFTVYLINIAHMTYTMLSAAKIISLPMVLLLTPVWSSFIRKFGWYRVLPFSFLGYAVSLFLNIFITESTQYFFYIVLIVSFLFSPCIDIVFAYLPYINMPDTNRTAYISTYAFCISLLTLAANFLGNRFYLYTQGKTMDFFGLKLLNYQYVHFIPFTLLILLAIFVFLGSSMYDERR